MCKYMDKFLIISHNIQKNCNSFRFVDGVILAICFTLVESSNIPILDTIYFRYLILFW
jgi:hypothetical protein